MIVSATRLRRSTAVFPRSNGEHRIRRVAPRRGREVFETDPLVQVWMVHHLEILGEACRAVTAELRAAYPEVPWAAIVGMRNVLAHDYFGIDLAEVWSTVERDLPPLRSQLVAVLAHLPEPPST